MDIRLPSAATSEAAMTNLANKSLCTCVNTSVGQIPRRELLGERIQVAVILKMLLERQAALKSLI